MLRNLLSIILAAAATPVSAQEAKPLATADKVREQIVAAYQRSLDALQRGDADAAMAIDTDDWVSVTTGQKPRTRKKWSRSFAGISLT